MTKTDLKEAAGVLRAVVAAVLASGGSSTIADGADLFRQCGALSAGAEAAILNGALGLPLLGCFDAAYAAGASLTSIVQVRTLAVGLTPAGRPARAVQRACIRLALVEYAKIIADTPIVSRQTADTLLADVHAAFDAAEVFAADQGSSDAYRSLVSLHALVAFDLVTRSRPLPQMVAYSFPRRLPALTLSQRLYGDGARADELIAENRPSHPLFMPSSGLALSA